MFGGKVLKCIIVKLFYKKFIASLFIKQRILEELF